MSSAIGSFVIGVSPIGGSGGGGGGGSGTGSDGFYSSTDEPGPAPFNVEATILSQYANSPIIRTLINNFNDYIDPDANIDAFYNNIWNINTAVGYGLDVWGRIVGVGRVLEIANFDYFGFTGPAGASGLPFNQGIFYDNETTTMNFSLLDDPYRVLILAKALFNISDGSIPGINQILINLFGENGLLPVAGNSYCTDNGNMTMTYTFSSALDPVQTAIVFQSGVLPRPCGVLATVVAP